MRITLTLVFLASTTLANAQGYTVQELGVLPGGSGVPRALNSSGVIVGRTGGPHGGGTDAFMWTPGKGSKKLGRLRSGDFSGAFAINDAGSVAGWANSANSVQAFVWSNSRGMENLGEILQARSSRAYAINNGGQVAGSYVNAKGETRAFVWNRQSGVTSLSPLDGDVFAAALAIDQTGNAVGESSGAPGKRAVMWDRSGKAKELAPVAGFTESNALAINGNGTIVGYVARGESVHAVAWRGDAAIDLGTLPGGTYSQAFGVNNRETVVGAAGSPLGTRAFVWTEATGMEDLNTKINVPHIFLAGASAINERGQIVAYGTYQQPQSNTGDEVQLDHSSHAGELRVFLLTPTKK